MRRGATTSALIITVVAAWGFLGFGKPADATSLVIDSGPLIKTEICRNFTCDGSPPFGTAPVGFWNSLTFQNDLEFTFHLPQSAAVNGFLNVYAGGDLNQATDVGGPQTGFIDVYSGALSRLEDLTFLGRLVFPTSDVHPSQCNFGHPIASAAGCPTPETVPNGRYNPVHDGSGVIVQGKREVGFDFAPGIIVPQDLLTAGRSLTFTLAPNQEVFDVYFDRVTLDYPNLTPPGNGGGIIPEPSTWLLLSSGLAWLIWRKYQNVTVR